jgi:phosphate-selective porin OprO/OprP
MNLNKKLAAAVSSAVLLMAGQVALADSSTDIVDALVMKGVLTEEEGRLITKGHNAKAKVTPVAKEKDGALFLETPDGSGNVSIGGRIHFDYRDYNENGDSNAALSSTAATPSTVQADTFDIRRARITTKFKFAKYYSGEVTINTVGAVNVLDVGYMDVSWFEKAKFRFGQFKMPFSLEQLTSSNNIDFIERSFVDAYIPAKEVGLQLFGSPTKGMTYALAASNGYGSANSTTAELDNRQDGKDIIGRLTYNMAEAMGDKEKVMHLGASFSAGESPLSGGFGGNRSTEARGLSFYTQPVVSPIGQSDKSQTRTRWNLEGAFAFNSTKIQAQYTRQNHEFTVFDVNQDHDINTGYVQVLHTLTGEKWADRYKDGAFGALKPIKNFDGDTMTGGAWEVGARYSSFDASDFNSATLIATPTATGTTVGNGLVTKTAGYTKANAVSVGVKFWANPNFRMMAEYVYTDFNGLIGTTIPNLNGREYKDEQAILMRTQIMF